MWPLFFFIFSQEMSQNFKKKLVESRKFIHISAILEDFLTEKEKNNKMKKFRLVDTFLKYGLFLLLFSQEMPQNLKKHVFRPFWRTS